MFPVRSQSSLPCSYRIDSFWRMKTSPPGNCPLLFSVTFSKREAGLGWSMPRGLFPLQPPPSHCASPALPFFPRMAPITPCTEEIKVLFLNFRLRLPCFYASLLTWPSSLRGRTRVLSSLLSEAFFHKTHVDRRLCLRNGWLHSAAMLWPIVYCQTSCQIVFISSLHFLFIHSLPS